MVVVLPRMGMIAVVNKYAGGCKTVIVGDARYGNCRSRTSMAKVGPYARA